MRHWRVLCIAAFRHAGNPCTCDWAGYRTADEQQEAAAKPCPQCGCPVEAYKSSYGRRRALFPR